MTINIVWDNKDILNILQEKIDIAPYINFCKLKGYNISWGHDENGWETIYQIDDSFCDYIFSLLDQKDLKINGLTYDSLSEHINSVINPTFPIDNLSRIC